MPWEIEYFEKDNGDCPTLEFLNNLSQKIDLAYIRNAMRQLEEHGYQLKRPHVDYLEDGIYELRVRRINIQYRFLYFFFDGNKIIITNGFMKKSGPVPTSEKNKAKDYRTIYYARKR